MAQFLTPIDVRLIGRQSFLLLAPLVYENRKFKITVMDGFDFDGASIPRVLWSAIGCPMGELYSRAACLHDALYASKIFPKDMCDRLFLEAMKSDGVDIELRKAMFKAVYYFGMDEYNDSEELQKYRNLINIEVKNG